MIKMYELVNNGYTLRGLYNEVENSKGIVIMFHGFTGHLNENGYLFKFLSDELAKINVSSIRFDFMGSGMSDGYFKDMTFKTELSDARCIIEHVKKIKGDQPLYVLGFSMGGAVAGCMSSEYYNDIDKLILLAPAGCMKEHARAYLNVPAERWVDEESIEMGGYTMSKKYIDSFDDLEMYRGIENFKKPVLICHGESDKAVPVEFGKKYSEIYEDAKFYMIPNAEHCFTKVNHRKELYSHIINFLK